MLWFKEKNQTKSCKEITSNGKQHSQYTNCTNPDKDVSNVPVIPGINCIRSQHKIKDLPTAQNISDEPFAIGSKTFQISPQITISICYTEKGDKSPRVPENTSNCTDKAQTPPTLQTKNDKTFDPVHLRAKYSKSPHKITISTYHKT